MGAEPGQARRWPRQPAGRQSCSCGCAASRTATGREGGSQSRASQPPGGCSHPREALPPGRQRLPLPAPAGWLQVRDLHHPAAGPPDLPADGQGQGRRCPGEQNQPAGLRPPPALGASPRPDALQPPARHGCRGPGPARLAAGAASRPLPQDLEQPRTALAPPRTVAFPGASASGSPWGRAASGTERDASDLDSTPAWGLRQLPASGAQRPREREARGARRERAGDSLLSAGVTSHGAAK